MSFPEIYEFHGDWTTYVEELYDIYLNDVVNAGLLFNNLPIRARFKPMTDNKGFGFWHIISDGAVEEERNIDFRRCERLPWVPYWISEAKMPPAPISWWKNKRGTDTHIVIFNEETRYVVILAEHKEYYLLKTAYTARGNRVQQLMKERDKYWC